MSFYDDSLETIFRKGGKIADIGGGLQIHKTNRTAIREHNKHLLDYAGVEYIVLDKVPTYHPDIVADVRKMPFADNEVDAFVCWRVLEHVEEPVKGTDEIFRCLKPGGLLYAEFFFFSTYNTLPGYYTDFFRFTEDGVRYLLRNFSSIEMVPMAGPIETWVGLVFPKYAKYVRIFDKLRKGGRKKNVSGYRVLATK